MCDYCKKIKVTKYGLIVDIEIARGLYDNHGAPRYAVCRQDDFVYSLELKLSQAKEIVKNNQEWLDLKIIDLKTMRRWKYKTFRSWFS